MPRAKAEVWKGAEMEPESRHNEDRFRLLLEAAPDAILEIDADGRITLVNAAAEQVFGYTRGDLIGLSLEILVPESKRFVHVRHRAEYARNPRVRPMGAGLELEAQRKDGTLFPVEISLSPNTSSAGASVIAIVRDVSQRNRLEQMLRRSEERLRQAEKLEALGRLAGGVAHEFNNLFTMVLGYADLLMPAVADETPRTYVQKISVSARRAASLTRQLLAFGQRQMLMPRTLDLNAVVIESCRIASRLLGENIEIVVLPALEPAWIHMDPAQIDQIIANLASNAHAAMPDGGKITVAVSRIEVDEQNIERHAAPGQGNYVLLSVSDTGSGMMPEVQARLFEPFFSTREFGKGTGLGLASIYGIVIQSGGSITVQSEPGIGTTFQIYLPNVLPEEETVTVAPEKEPMESLPGSETILLVEDQAPLLDLSREFLKKQGYHLLTASHPEKALEISRAFAGTIDLLLTDVLMPGMDGRELARQLRQQRPEMKVLYVSGFADRVFENVELHGPSEAFMEKPYGFEALGHKIREML